MDRFKPLDFLFNLGDFVLLFVSSVLAVAVLLAAILISLLSSVLLNTANMGIVRDRMNIQVMEEIDGKTHFDELIDPALVFISDSARKTEFNLLNNVKNSMIDNF